MQPFATFMQSAGKPVRDQSRSLDVSEAMLRSARASLARFNLAARIVLRNGEATGFDPVHLFAVHGFDRVFISYALSMIPGLAKGCEARCRRRWTGRRTFHSELWRRAQLARLRRFSVAPIPALDRKIGMPTQQMGFTAVTERLYGG